MMQMYPYVMNVNEDAQLSGVVKLFIQEGECRCRLALRTSDGSRPCIHLTSVLLCEGDWDIGLADNSPRALSIRGLG